MSIYEKLMHIQQELKAPKGQYNSFGKYKYRSCEDILEALKPVLFKYNCAVTLTDSVYQVGERYYIKANATIVDCENGEQACNIALAREDVEKKGMDGSQITGTASSYARKYALNGLFLIDDTKDADTDAYHNQTNPEDTKVAAAKEKAKAVKKALVKLNGGDIDAANAMWKSNYKKDENDIVKMNAALIDLEEKIKQVSALDA